MTPREHLRKMTALGEQSPLDEKHWYRLVNSMSAAELRQRQELMIRNQMALTPQLLTQTPQRLQPVPGQFEPRFVDRELVPPPDMVPPEARQMHMGPPLGPPLNPHATVVPGRSFPAAGYGFLPPESMETVARRQELMHKQNIARMEMNAILQQKELESVQQKGLISMESTYPGIPAGAAVYRGRQRLPEGHLPGDVFLHRSTLEDLRVNGLLASAGPYPPIAALQRERGRRNGRRAVGPKVADAGLAKTQLGDKGAEPSPGEATEDKDVDGKEEAEGELAAEVERTKGEGEASMEKSYEQREGGGGKCSDGAHDSGEKNIPDTCLAFHHDKFAYTSPSLASGPFAFPMTGETLLMPGAHPFLNGEVVSSAEDIRKWTVDDVYNFVTSIPSCSEYAQTFRDHVIDGETLPLLSEEHLLDTMGLKLGPALKIRSHVARRLGHAFYAANLALAGGLARVASDKSVVPRSESGSPAHCNGEDTPGSPSPGEGERGKPCEAAARPESTGAVAVTSLSNEHA